MSRIPEDHSVSVTYADVDGEDQAVYWEYRNSAMGELIASGIRDGGNWRPLVEDGDVPRSAQLVLADKGVTL